MVPNDMDMQARRSPGYKSLRKGRYSQEHSRYFITTCTADRKPILLRDSIPKLLFSHLFDFGSHCELIASVVMPDHMHFVIKLGPVGLATCIQEFKSTVSDEMEYPDWLKNNPLG